MNKKWIFKEPVNINDNARELCENAVLAKIIAGRGIKSETLVKKFLSPLEVSPISPYVFSDMQKAVDRIKKAIQNSEKIIVYGDFDADGVTSSALLFKTLKVLGASVSYFIPNRCDENHGLNKTALIKLISKEKAKLIITVDCGISDVQETALVNSFNVDVIITDHHEAPDELPDAVAIINPKAKNALCEELEIEKITDLSNLAGVGVAFKLACALLEDAGEISYSQELLPLVALGTIADIVPLLGENRTLAAMGLDLIQKGKNKGITALLQSSGVRADEEITSEKIAFTIAPRINAAGRLASAEDAFKLLISENEKELEFLTQSLNNYNKIRQELCDKTFEEALEIIEKSTENKNPAIFVFNRDWHIGIIGIVASKLVDIFNKPVFMMTKDPNDDKIRCSIRSTSGIHIFNVLELNSEHLLSFGGHAMAAGLSMPMDKKILELFKKNINDTIKEITRDETPEPVLEIDIELEPNELDLELLKSIKKLEPLGASNPEPVFAMKNLTFISEKTMGQTNSHLKFLCKAENGKTFECVFWNNSSLNIPSGTSLDIAFSPKINEFNGNISLQLDIKDYKSDAIVQKNETPLPKIIDHRKKTNVFSQLEDYIKTTETKFKIFAEDKGVISQIFQYKCLKECTVNRLNYDKTEQLIFFDYPASSKVLEEIIKTSAPDTIHFMNYSQKLYDIDEVIKQISGMLKYAHREYSGEIFIPVISSALALSDEVVISVIKLLSEKGAVTVNDYRKNTLKFEFNAPLPLQELKENEYYEKSRIELFKVKNFREELLTEEDISKIIKKS